MQIHATPHTRIHARSTCTHHRTALSSHPHCFLHLMLLLLPFLLLLLLPLSPPRCPCPLPFFFTAVSAVAIRAGPPAAAGSQADVRAPPPARGRGTHGRAAEGCILPAHGPALRSALGCAAALFFPVPSLIPSILPSYDTFYHHTPVKYCSFYDTIPIVSFFKPAVLSYALYHSVLSTYDTYCVILFAFSLSALHLYSFYCTVYVYCIPVQYTVPVLGGTV